MPAGIPLDNAPAPNRPRRTSIHHSNCPGRPGSGVLAGAPCQDMTLLPGFNPQMSSLCSSSVDAPQAVI